MCVFDSRCNRCARSSRCDRCAGSDWAVPYWFVHFSDVLCTNHKKLSYRRGTARCVVSVEILPTATQQCRNYLYDKS